MEKYYWIIKYNGCDQFEKKLDARNEEEAVKLFKMDWSLLHKKDKEDYITFDLVYLEQSEDGEYPNLDNGYTPIASMK